VANTILLEKSYPDGVLVNVAIVTRHVPLSIPVERTQRNCDFLHRRWTRTMMDYFSRAVLVSIPRHLSLTDGHDAVQRCFR